MTTATITVYRTHLGLTNRKFTKGEDGVERIELYPENLEVRIHYDSGQTVITTGFPYELLEKELPEEEIDRTLTPEDKKELMEAFSVASDKIKDAKLLDFYVTSTNLLREYCDNNNIGRKGENIFERVLEALGNASGSHPMSLEGLHVCVKRYVKSHFPNEKLAVTVSFKYYSVKVAMITNASALELRELVMDGLKDRPNVSFPKPKGASVYFKINPK
jgi:hypothetical protein